MIDALRDLNRAQDQAIVLFRARLSALRRNCFITNERGHRVRYSKASPDLRAMAETE